MDTDTTDTAEPDVSPGDTSQPDTEPDVTVPLCDNDGFIRAADSFVSSQGQARYTAVSSTTDPHDRLLIEFWSGLPGPGTYELGVDPLDQNYATCDTCVLVRTDCDAQGSCEKMFFATRGTVVITEVSIALNSFVGTLNNVELVEVTLDALWNSTPVPDGEDWCIAEYAFDTSIGCRLETDCAGHPGGPFCNNATCSATCNNMGFTAAFQETRVSGHVDYEARSSTTGPYDSLKLELYNFGTVVPAPTTLELGATIADSSYDTCQNCALLQRNCDANGVCEKTFFAISGTVTLTEVDRPNQSIAGTLTNAKFVEIHYGAGPATPVPGGETWCIGSLALDAAAECLVDADCAGHPNGDICHENHCAGRCDFNAFGPVAQHYSATGNDARYVGMSALSLPRSELEFRFTPAPSVGAYPLGSTVWDLDNGYCDTCVLLSTDCTLAGCSRHFFAVRGTVDVTAVDNTAQTIAGTLTNARLIEVTLDSAQFSTPVPGGSGWCIANLPFAGAP